MHDVGLALEILLDDPYPSLWDSRCKRETLRFLRKRGRDIPQKALSRLLKAILTGPPRGSYSEDLTDDNWGDLRDHQIRVLLYKLQESGAQLAGISDACRCVIRDQIDRRCCRQGNAC